MSAQHRHWLDRLALRTGGAPAGRNALSDPVPTPQPPLPAEDQLSRNELLRHGARLGATAFLAGSLGLARIPGAHARTSESCAATCRSEWDSAVAKAARICATTDLSKTHDFFFKNPFTYAFNLPLCLTVVSFKAGTGENACLANCEAKKEPAPAPTAAQLAPPPPPPPVVDPEGALTNLGCCNGAPGNLKCCFDYRNLGGRCCIASISCKSCTGG